MNDRTLLELEDVLARIDAAAAPHRIVETEHVSTFDALGRVLAAEVRSLVDVPPADNSAMDGYALRAADVGAAGTVLPVAQRIPAGAVGTPLAAGTAARIFTGAPVPAGADTVVMQEDCEAIAGPGFGSVRVLKVPARGAAVRLRGEDVASGSVVLARGTRLAPQALGMAASIGCGEVAVLRRPRVALFSTGDELMMPGETLRPGAIYNSNRYTLRGLLQAAGCTVRDLGIVPDRLDATRAALRDAAGASDLILSCGGVSVGEEDHLKDAVAAEGRLDLWQVSIKPGKPFALGRVDREREAALYVGLPGNPVSSWVTFLLCVGPLLRALQGLSCRLPPALPLRADFDRPKPDRRREFLRVRINAAGGLDLFANQGSGVLTSTVWADGLVDHPAGRTIAAGDTVRYLPLSSLIGW